MGERTLAGAEPWRYGEAKTYDLDLFGNSRGLMPPFLRNVKALVERQLGASGCGIERTAQQLGLHKRTLQRRLEAQGLHFEKVLDELRRERARELLPHRAILLNQMGQMLGYSEQSSFNRACRRWFGRT